MRLLIALALILALGASTPLSSPGTGGTALSSPGIGASSVGGGGACSYTTGQGTTVTGATAYWGLRAYDCTNADGTHKSINITRASDSETCDVLLTTTGALGNTTACTGADNGITTVAFCNSTTCSVNKWYDQSGNGFDVTNNSAGKATLQASATISSQSVTIGTSGYCSAGAVSLPQIVSLSSVYKNQTGTLEDYFGGDSTALQVGTDTAGTAVFIYAGTLQEIGSVNSAIYHANQSILNGASSQISLDGSTTTGLNPGAGDSTFTRLCVAAGSALDALVGTGMLLREVGVWPNAAAANFLAAISTLNSNQHTYWGF